MDRELRSQVSELGGDPTSPVWMWFLLNGPHGTNFTWGQTRSKPAGYVSFNHLQEIVSERQQADPAFFTQLRDVIALALNSSTPIFLRRAIQVVGAMAAKEQEGRIALLIATQTKAWHLTRERTSLSYIAYGYRWMTMNDVGADKAMKAHWLGTVFVVMFVLTMVYLGVWFLRVPSGIISPTANLRYFYYGAAPCTHSDSILYWFFRPAYETSLAIETLLGHGRTMIHWSDRDGGQGYEHLCQGRILGV